MSANSSENVKFITHKGKRILYQTVENGKSADDNIAVFDEAERIIKMQPEQSVLLLTNVVGAHYNTEAADALKRFSANVTPYVIASAAVGVSGIKRIILMSLIRISGRDIKMFETIDQAKDWLVEQDAKQNA